MNALSQEPLIQYLKWNLQQSMTNKHFNGQQIKKVTQATIDKMVKQALCEDIGVGDINALLIDKNAIGCAQVITRENMVLCGCDWVNEIFKQIDPKLTTHWFFSDGDAVDSNKKLFETTGHARSILSAERVALNFLQMLSAVATKTRQYVNKIAHTNAKVLDTRKTLPGFRLAQKYAVYCGGGINHRIGLFDAFLIKENHIAACGHSIIKAIETARTIASLKMIEVEVENFNQLQEALDAKADIIMLDNFSVTAIKKAVRLVDGGAKLEVSGNVSFENIVEIAKTGVDFVSIGDLTKNIKAIDLSMRLL